MNPDRMDEIQNALRDVLRGAEGARNGRQKPCWQGDVVGDQLPLAVPAFIAEEMLNTGHPRLPQLVEVSRCGQRVFL